MRKFKTFEEGVKESLNNGTFSIGDKKYTIEDISENIDYSHLPLYKMGGETLDSSTASSIEKKSSTLTLEEILAGEKVSDNIKGEVNAELEDGEFLMYPDGVIQEVVGEDHEKGGVKLNLPEGTLVLSNHLKVDKKLSKQLKEDFDINVKTSDTYSKAIEKFSEKTGFNKLVKDQEFLIKKLDSLDKESPSYKVNAEYVQGKLAKIEQDKQDLNEQRRNIFSILFGNQEESKPKENNTDVFEMGGEILKGLEEGKYEVRGNVVVHARTGVEVHVLEKSDVKLLENTFGVEFTENTFSDETTFQRQKQSATKEGGFGKITKENLKESLEFAYKNFPEIAEREFGAGYDENGNFVYDSSIDFSKANKNVERYQEAVNNVMISNAEDIINNPDRYNPEDVKAAREFREKETFNKGLARDFDGKWGNFTAGRFNLKDSIKPVEVSQEEVETKNTNTDSEVIDNTKDLLANRRKKGDFVYLPPDQSLLPPSALEPHLKVKNRFQRIDPVKIGIEQNLQEAFRQQQFLEGQVSSSNPAIQAAFLANTTANTQNTVNNAITQTNVVNAQNRQRAEQFNIGQADREDRAEGINALDFERRQLTAKAKTDKDLRDYFAHNRSVQLNNILREQQLSAIDALSEDFSIDPFGNTFYDPMYEFRPASSQNQKQESLDEQRKKADLALKQLRIAKEQRLNR